MNDLPSTLALRSPQELAAPSLTSPAVGASKATLQQAAREFEGMLMRQLFQTLRKTVEPSGLLGDSGGARNTYDYLFDQAVVEQAMASGKGWGLAARLEASWVEKEAGARKPQEGSRT